MNKKKNIFYSVGVHQGGGKAIFENFVNSLNKDSDIELIIDNRLKTDFKFLKNFKFKVANSNFFARILHEYKLKKFPKNLQNS